jgi:putative aldouronate transport system permease protein
MRNRNAIREPLGDRILTIFIYVALSVFLIVVLYPLLNIVASSFSDPKAVIRGEVTIFPIEPTLLAYKTVFKNSQVIIGFGNTIFYTVVGTIVQLILTVLIAFPLSRKEFVGRKVIMMALVFTMFFEGGLIPTYMIVKELGLVDTRWALIIPKALGVWQVIIAVTFFKTSIPNELYESAQLDGSSDIGFIWRIVMPLAKPIIAVLVLMYAVGNWNSYFDALIYLNSQDLYPLQLVLRNILVLNQMNTLSPQVAYKMAHLQGLADLLKYALIVVSSLPILLFYPFIQKHFVKGMMIGSVKE